MENDTEKQATVKATAPAKVVTTKKVRNRSGHRIELVIGSKVYVFLPGKVTEVPADALIPGNLGLNVR